MPGMRAGRAQSAAAATLSLLSLAACGPDATGPASGPGDVRVVTATTGRDLDPDGYTLIVDQDESRTIGVNDTVTASSVPAGRFVFELDGLASNCAVQGDNPRSVRVVAGELTETIFDVACAALEGDLEVTASTTGEDVDPDGYTVAVDGGEPRPLERNGSVSFGGLPPGTHDVELGDVASNCAVSGDNPRQVDVPSGATGSTTFEVTCEPRVGDLEVTVSTTGEDPDPDGYTVTVDDVRAQAVERNGTVTFRDLAAGQHEVRLEGAASNCTVQGEVPRTVEVPEGGTTAVTIEVVCEAREGNLEVAASTTGEKIDPNGYTAVLDGSLSRSLERNGSIVFRDLQPGPHDVMLEGVAPNCSVAGDNPRTVDVPGGETAITTFQVRCGDDDEDDD